MNGINKTFAETMREIAAEQNLPIEIPDNISAVSFDFGIEKIILVSGGADSSPVPALNKLSCLLVAHGKPIVVNNNDGTFTHTFK